MFFKIVKCKVGSYKPYTVGGQVEVYETYESQVENSEETVLKNKSSFLKVFDPTLFTYLKDQADNSDGKMDFTIEGVVNIELCVTEKAKDVQTQENFEYKRHVFVPTSIKINNVTKFEKTI